MSSHVSHPPGDQQMTKFSTTSLERAITMKKLILIASLFASFAAHAVGSSLGTVSAIWSTSTGVVMVQSSAVSSGTPPSCATVTGLFAIDATTAGGKELAANLRYAAALGKTVSFLGLGGACSLWSTVENLDRVYITN